MGGNVEYPLLDALGSVRQLTSNTGVNLLKRSYTADGSIRFSSGSGISRLGFAGELQDTTTGIVYLRARHYNPALGRFLQRDSFGGFAQRPQSLNRYSYAENNAVNYTDPSGQSISSHINNMLSKAGSDIRYTGSTAANWGREFSSRTLQSGNPLLAAAQTIGNRWCEVWTPAVREMVSMGIMFVPVIGNFYGMAVALGGYDPISGRHLSTTERLILGIGSAIGIGMEAHAILAAGSEVAMVGRFGESFADDMARETSERSQSMLFHSGQDGIERASPELLDAMRGQGREIVFATEGSEELRYLDHVGAAGSSNGPTSILLRENPSKSTALEEFLHGTQSRLGISERLEWNASAIEAHVKDFMIRHQQMLGLSDEDVQILQVLKDMGL